MLESVRNRLRIPRLRGFIPVLAIGAIILAGACDFQVLEPWDSPRWGVSLTLPLINRTYYLADLAENDTTISTDTLTQELQIEFIGSLDTTQIDSSFLEVQLPSVATSRSISETVDGINASDLLPEDIVETVRIEIALDSLLRAAPLPLFDDVSFPTIIDVVIPQADWNAHIATAALDQEEGPFEVIDTTTAFEDFPFIERMRYLRLESTAFSSKFHTTVENNGFPTSVDSIRISLASGSLLSVIHAKDNLIKNSTYDDSTDLAGQRLGSELSFGLSMLLPQATGDVTIEAGDSAKLAFRIGVSIGGIDSLAITTSQASLLPEDPDPLPLPSNIAIQSGVLRSDVTSPVNEVSIAGLSNTLPFDVRFQLTFSNFTSPSDSSLVFGDYTLSDGDMPVNETKVLAGYTFSDPTGEGVMEEFSYDVLAEVVAGDIAIPLDGSPLGAFQVGIEFGDIDEDGRGDLYFDSITGNFEISFDAVNTTIEKIPTGFAGFQFGRLSLGLLLRNQIDLPVQLDLRLTGFTLEGDSISVPINAPINYPSAPGAPASNGDTAYTLIILDESTVGSYWLTEGASDRSAAWDSTITDAGDGGTIVDVLNLPPDIIEVSGAAVVEGEGVVEAGKGIWGDFILIAPFAFILPHDISFLPVDPIPWKPMDTETREQIQTALLSASLTSTAQTNFPIGGKISMLVSDTTRFTLALDYLDDIAAGIPTAARTGDTTVYTNIQDVLEADSILGVEKIVFYPESPKPGETLLPQNTQARKVEFYTAAGDTFWIGHLFDMELPAPRSVGDQGWVTLAGDTTQIIALDAERVTWIASDAPLYLKTFITLYGTEGIRTIQATNTIHFAAYITFDFESEVYAAEQEPDSSEIGVTAVDDITLGQDSIAVINLDSVFTPPAGMELKDLEIWASSSHTGIARTTIRTIRVTGGTRKVLQVHALGLGTARISVFADDDPEDDIPPAKVIFLATVEDDGGASMPPRPTIRMVKGATQTL